MDLGNRDNTEDWSICFAYDEFDPQTCLFTRNDSKPSLDGPLKPKQNKKILKQMADTISASTG